MSLFLFMDKANVRPYQYRSPLFGVFLFLVLLFVLKSGLQKYVFNLLPTQRNPPMESLVAYARTNIFIPTADFLYLLLMSRLTSFWSSESGFIIQCCFRSPVFIRSVCMLFLYLSSYPVLSSTFATIVLT